MFRNLPSLCKGIIVALGVSMVLSLAVPSFTISVLPLFPPLMVQGQIWRLVTYPFFMLASMHSLIGSIFTLVWAGIIIAMFGGELETIIHSNRLTIALSGAVIVGGIFFSLLSSGGALAGPGILTMFMVAGFSYLWPKREISVFGLFWVKAWVIAVAVYILSIIPMNGSQLDVNAANLFGPTFGVLAAVAYFHITYRQYRFGKAMLDKSEAIFKRKRGPLLEPSDPKSVEARIDSILDKIASSGMQSLSKQEREFLLRNSKKP